MGVADVSGGDGRGEALGTYLLGVEGGEGYPELLDPFEAARRRQKKTPTNGLVRAWAS